MKEFFKKIVGWALFILLVPLIVLVLLLWLCSWPLDWFRYRRSRYYKDTGEKFRFMSNRFVRLYDTVKGYHLPLTFLRDTSDETNAYGFWVIKNAAIVVADGVEYETETNKWTAEEEDENGITVNQEIAGILLEDCQKLPGGEHCDFIYLLVDDTDVPLDAVLSFDTYRVVPTSLKNPLHSLQEIVKEQTGKTPDIPGRFRKRVFNGYLFGALALLAIFGGIAVLLTLEKLWVLAVLAWLFAAYCLFSILISPLYTVFTEEDITIVYVLGQKERIRWKEIRFIHSRGSLAAKTQPRYEIAYPHEDKRPFFVSGEIPKTRKIKKIIESRWHGTIET